MAFLLAAIDSAEHISDLVGWLCPCFIPCHLCLSKATKMSVYSHPILNHGKVNVRQNSFLRTEDRLSCVQKVWPRAGT